MAIRVGIVEDDPALRTLFAELVELSEGLTCAGAYETGERALDAMPAQKPDAILMDINLPGMSGIDCTRRLKERLPGAHIIMLTTFDDAERVFESLKAGATGYVLKRVAARDIVRAIHEACEGCAPMTGTIARKVVQFFHDHQRAAEVERLTDRERDVLAALSEGQQYKEIADQLSISINTVRKHIKRIYEKLHVNTRAEAVRKLGRV